MKLRHPRGTQSQVAAPPCLEEPDEVARHTGHIPGEVFDYVVSAGGPGYDHGKGKSGIPS